jgi:hypothetical protein
MKKIMLALVGAIASLTGSAQPFFTSPTHTPLVMPPLVQGLLPHRIFMFIAGMLPTIPMVE